MKLLLLGKDGQVGWELQRALAPLGEVTALGRADADMSRPDELAAVLALHGTDAIINAAAYTAVDKAESEADLARAVNTDSVAVLAEHAARSDVWLVHYSTDYVFDGEGDQPYRETDPTAPLGVYGATKRDGELAIASSGAKHMIFRTSWVHGSHSANFARTMLRLARERATLRVVADQIGAPTGAALIADITPTALRLALSGEDVSGLYHLAAAGETSWHDYARLVIAEAMKLGVPLAATPDRVEAITTTQYPTPAKRPLNSRLDTTRLRHRFHVALPDWRDGVRQTVREIVCGEISP